MRTVPFSAGANTKYYIIIAFVVVIILLIVFRTQLQALVTGKPATPAATPPAKATPPATVATSSTVAPAAPGLNMNLLLSYGSSGPEVSQLQTWLGVTPIDGQFGPDTQNTLYQAAGVYSTTLAGFQTLIQGFAAAQNNAPAASGVIQQAWNNVLSGNGIFG